jgi:hypothetical protein
MNCVIWFVSGMISGIMINKSLHVCPKDFERHTYADGSTKLTWKGFQICSKCNTPHGNFECVEGLETDRAKYFLRLYDSK